MDLASLWHSSDLQAWESALDSYWDRIPESRIELERRMNDLDRSEIRSLDAHGWATFLREDYFPWKYTDGRILACSRRWLIRHIEEKGEQSLLHVRDLILDGDPKDAATMLHFALRIPGLGVAGASGLLSLLHPRLFGTVDQFLVRALQGLSLPQSVVISEMEPENLSGLDGVILTQILRGKARELAAKLKTEWTPRMLDMVLWAVRPEQ